MARRLLVVGLGNPGEYDGTRHNIGFAALDRFALKNDVNFQKKLKFKASIAEGMLGDTPFVLLKPLTFMNLSGEAIALAMRYLGVELSSLLVVLDDVDLPLGQLRLKINSGAGTHNGLKSVEQHLATNRYARLRIGIGEGGEEDLAEHVLGRFTEEEKKLLPEILGRAVQAIEIWMDQGVTRAMDFANRKNPSNPSNGEETT